jgi:putative membrane-bound dehydrogenase-like protein
MMKWPNVFFVGLASALGAGLLTPPCHAQLPPEKAASTFTVSDGLQMSLWASEPLFCNPTCIDIDHKGRVWVCESVNYRCTLHHRPLKRPEGDRIVILEDTKGVGRADRATVFYQSPELLAPLGIAVAKDPVGPGYKVYVCQSPNILVFEDRDGDGKADGPPKKLLTGFGGIDHDHGVHGILIGPDGKLYFSVGDTGVHGLQSSDGKGRKWYSNNTDCRAGTIWRCDLDGRNLELLAHNFRNEYEPCVDSAGNIYVSDNDDDGNEQTRICYVMPGGNYGYHPRGPRESHWHEEQPGVVPKILRTYFGSPTGMCVYEGTLLPNKYWYMPLHTDAGPGHVRCYHVTPNGAGFDVDREDMVKSNDKWFRPSDICVAPDGSVFVSDWYDPGVGGHNIGDFTRGRIYRITPKGHRGYAVPKVDVTDDAGLLDALASPNLAVRHMGIQRVRSLGLLGAFTLPRLIQKAHETKRLTPLLLLRMLWAFNKGPHEWTEVTEVPGLEVFTLRLLKSHLGDLSASSQEVPAAKRNSILRDCVRHPKAYVRRELLLALRDTDPKFAAKLIYELAKRYEGNDRFYLEAIGIAVGHHDKARRDIILADFAKQFPELNDKVLDLVWELQPPQMFPVLEKRLADGRTPVEQRSRIVDILAASTDPGAGKTLLGVFQANPPVELRDRILQDLKQNLAGKWRDLRQSPELTAAIDSLLAQPQTQAMALALIGAAEKADATGKVIALARGLHTTPELRKAAVQTLGSLPNGQAVDALKGLALSDKEEVALRQAAVAALAGNRAGTIWLLDTHEKRGLPAILKSETARLLRNTPYGDLRARAMRDFPPPGRLDPKQLPSIAALVGRKGNAKRGEQLMAASVKSDLQCLKCHTIRGVGGQVGPDLSVIGKKGSRENLFESILLPSKAIADQYINWVIQTNQDQVLTGLIVEDTPSYLTLRDANGKDTKIDKKEVASRTRSPNSIMPSDLLASMTEDDLVDMVEYLAELKTSTLAMDYWHIVGPFDNGDADAGLDQVFPPEKEVNLRASYSGKSGPVRWRVVKPNADGYVDLQAFYGAESVNIVSYLYREVESPADQEARISLGTDDGAKLWVNGKLVYTSRLHRAAAPGQDEVTVKLKKGRNRLLLKINNGDGAHGFYLLLLAEEELKRVEDK